LIIFASSANTINSLSFYASLDQWVWLKAADVLAYQTGRIIYEEFNMIS
jgi:hypothetical protein